MGIWFLGALGFATSTGRVSPPWLKADMSNFVGTKMKGASLVLAVLFVPLWLSTAVSGGIDPALAGLARSSDSRAFLRSTDRHQSTASHGAFDEPARPWIRRCHPTGPKQLSTPAILPPLWLPSDLSRVQIESKPRPELSQSWQFYWRTASRPRAPSCPLS